jgi:hypothetical protein
MERRADVAMVSRLNPRCERIKLGRDSGSTNGSDAVVQGLEVRRSRRAFGYGDIVRITLRFGRSHLKSLETASPLSWMRISESFNRSFIRLNLQERLLFHADESRLTQRLDRRPRDSPQQRTSRQALSPESRECRRGSGLI